MTWADIDPIAAFAAVVATAALALEVRRWFESGVHLRMSLICGARLMPSEFEDVSYLQISVANLGDRPVTLSSMMLVDFESRWNCLRRKRRWNALIPNPPENPNAPGLPVLLNPGQVWSGRFRYGDKPDIVARATRGWLYVGIQSSHRKRAFLKRMRALDAA